MGFQTVFFSVPGSVICYPAAAGYASSCCPGSHPVCGPPLQFQPTRPLPCPGHVSSRSLIVGLDLSCFPCRPHRSWTQPPGVPDPVARLVLGLVFHPVPGPVFHPLDFFCLFGITAVIVQAVPGKFLPLFIVAALAGFFFVIEG